MPTEFFETDITISDKPEIEYEEPCLHCLTCAKDAPVEQHENSCPVSTRARREKREQRRAKRMQSHIELEA